MRRLLGAGTKLPPLSWLERGEPSKARSDAEASVLAAQAAFYGALVTADAAGIEAMCVEEEDAEVSAIAASGRLDGWPTVLKYDATVGMVLSSADALVLEARRRAGTARHTAFARHARG